MRKSSRIICALFVFFITKGYGQGACPENIGFESGNFNNWKCYAGSIQSDNGAIRFNAAVPPQPDRHVLLQNTFPQQKDPFGHFPVNCPNGSGYSIRLGNRQVGSQADRVSYTFTVPPGRNDYSIIYNYAIVFQDPGHLDFQQPRFTTRVFDETEGNYLSCGAFEYVASSGLPGFKTSDVDRLIFYKEWTPVTVKLVNCAGKTITLEFTVNDCALSGHFGYAYLDINENCTSPITGNVYCNGTTSLTLTAPFGFKEYHWFTSDFSTLLGTSNTLHLDPIPPVGTRYALEIIPYPGLGCQDTLYTQIELSNDAFVFKLKDNALGCTGYPLDLTDPSLTAGSTPGIKYSYFIDSAYMDYAPTPDHIFDSGAYYVKAVNTAGCTDTKKINVSFHKVDLHITDPPLNCSPATIDITSPAITANSSPGLLFSYWLDNNATQPLTNPTSISQAETYFIQAQDNICSTIAPVVVNIIEPSSFETHAQEECGSVNITTPAATLGSSLYYTSFSYWRDNAATQALPDPGAIRTSNVYYIKATTASGCGFVKPIDVTVKPVPDFTITDPATVTAPYTVDITRAINSSNAYQYSFWTDTNATVPLAHPSSIEKTGVYYIKATDANSCSEIKRVNVTVIIPYHPAIKFPNAFSPNHDGVNDGFRVDVAGNITYKSLRIYDRWGRIVFQTNSPFEYWYGEVNGKPVPIGTYYWVMELVNNNNQDFYRRNGVITLVR